jgi:hypothetical protein
MAQAIPIALTAASTALSVGGTLSGASAQAKQLRGEADQLDAAAVADRASAQRTSIEQRRQARLLQSRALAVASASGGGASDPTVVNILARLSGEGEYRALTALYEGEEEARSKEMQARARRQEAKNVKKAALFSAGSKILETGSTLYNRYGPQPQRRTGT